MFNFKNEEELRHFIKGEALFTSEVAGLLNCTRQYVYKLVKTGKLNPIKTSKSERLFLKSDVLFFKNRKKE